MGLLTPAPGFQPPEASQIEKLKQFWQAHPLFNSTPWDVFLQFAPQYCPQFFSPSLPSTPSVMDIVNESNQDSDEKTIPSISWTPNPRYFQPTTFNI